MKESSCLSKPFCILFGSSLLALGINCFLIPNKLLDGGFIGAALLFNYLFNLHVGWLTILISAPIYMYAWFRHRPYFINSVYGLICSSFLIELICHLREISGFSFEMHPLLCSIAGGILVGSGSGLMLRHKISTEGSDLLGLFLAELFSMNVGIIILFIDILIISFGAFVMKDEPLLLSLIMVLTVSIVTSLFTRSAPGFSLPTRPIYVQARRLKKNNRS